MNFDEIWLGLEAQLPSDAGYLRQRIYGDSNVDLNLAMINPGQIRAVSLTVDGGPAADLGPLPQTRGMEHIMYHLKGSGRTRLELRLTDPAATDVFSALVADMTSAVARSDDDRTAVGGWIGRLARWQRLLQRAQQGLTPDRQRGLYAELWLIREGLSRAVGLNQAIDAWTGPSGASHDFQLPNGSVEVKSTASNQPQVVRISSERQLDDTGTPSLHLLHVSLDVHQHSGETLISMVSSLRALAEDGATEAELEERLVDVGYFDEQEGMYQTTGYTVREHAFYRVRRGFPRLVENDLVDGVGSVQYDLVVAACATYRVDDEGALEILRGGE